MEENIKIQTDQSTTNETIPLKPGDIQVGARNNGAIKVTVDEGTENSDGAPQKENFSCAKLPSRSRWTFVLICMGTFASGCVFYVMVPFYTSVGARRGVSGAVVGVIFSILHGFIFICSPVFGHFMPKIGARFMYVGGALVAGLSTMLFGMVDFCESGASFVALSLMCRATQAVGMSASVTAAFAILAHEFPKHTATVFSITEALNGVGFMAGPAIGGALFEVGGFMAPFLVTGGIMVWNGIQLYVLLPLPKAIPNAHKGSPLTLIKSPLFDVAALNIFTNTLAIQFLDPTLSVRLEQFHMSPSLVGLAFLTAPCAYAIVSPLVGYLTDTKNLPTVLLISGIFGSCIALLLLGPCPGLSFLPSDLWMVVLSTGMLGIFFGFTVAPVMNFMLRGAVEIGFPNHLDTYGLISGAFYSLMCGGGVIGNILGGALMDKYGFDFAALIVAALALVTTMITIVYFMYRNLVLVTKMEKAGIDGGK